MARSEVRLSGVDKVSSTSGNPNYIMEDGDGIVRVPSNVTPASRNVALVMLAMHDGRSSLNFDAGTLPIGISVDVRNVSASRKSVSAGSNVIYVNPGSSATIRIDNVDYSFGEGLVFSVTGYASPAYIKEDLRNLLSDLENGVYGNTSGAGEGLTEAQIRAICDTYTHLTEEQVAEIVNGASSNGFDPDLFTFSEYTVDRITDYTIKYGETVIGSWQIDVSNGVITEEQTRIHVGSDAPTDGSELWFDPSTDTSAYDVSQYYTPESFGAKGDGVTDDTAALNACLLRAHYDGKIVLLAPTTYLISGTIYVRKTTILRGTSIERTIIKNTNDEVYAIEVRSFHSEVHELTVESKYGIMVGGLDTTEKVAAYGYMGNRTIETLVRRVAVKDCKVGINCSYQGGYNRFEKCKVSTQIHQNDAIAYYVGEYTSGSAGVNYVYLTECTAEPLYEENYLHPREEGTTGLKVKRGTYVFLDKCDLVGYEKGVDVSGGTPEHIQIRATTLFNNTYAVWCNADEGTIKDVAVIDSWISGKGYYLWTEQPTGSRTYKDFRFINILCPNPTSVKNENGFHCYGLRNASFEGVASGSVDAVVRFFSDDCTFASYQHIHKAITQASSSNAKSSTLTIGDKLSLAPVSRPAIINYGTGNLVVDSYTDNGNGTATIGYTWSGGSVDAVVIS